MKTQESDRLMKFLLDPLSECLNEESARRLLAYRPKPEIQAQMDALASRHTEGTLSPPEEAEYSRYVNYATFIAILKSKARQLLRKSDGV